MAGSYAICPKVRFPTEEEANAVAGYIERLQARDGIKGERRRAQECPNCKGWHLEPAK